MDIRPTNGFDGSRHELQGTNDSTAGKGDSQAKVRADEFQVQAHAPHSRAPELVDVLRNAPSAADMRMELVALVKARLANGDYLTRESAERLAEKIVRS